MKIDNMIYTFSILNIHFNKCHCDLHIYGMEDFNKKLTAKN